jgi:predicted ABC-type ATPase
MIKQPILIVIAGPNGSGKTSLTTQILKHEWLEDCIYINPDNIAQEEFGDWNSAEAVLNAAKIATQRRESCIQNKQSLIFETVLSASDKIDFIESAKASGYFIRLFFVGTAHPSINASRIVRRVLEGGHDVPITKIISRYAKSIVNCCAVSNLVDRLYIYDNSVDFENAKLLFRATNGTIIKTYFKIPIWALPVWKCLNLEK